MMRKLFPISLRLCGAMLCVGLATAQESPWHLGATAGQVPAPAAINTVDEKPGPYRIVVAVIDSGVIAGHPSLEGQLLPGYDMVSASQNLRKKRSPDSKPDERGAKCGSRLMADSFRTHGTEVARKFRESSRKTTRLLHRGDHSHFQTADVRLGLGKGFPDAQPLLNTHFKMLKKDSGFATGSPEEAGEGKRKRKTREGQLPEVVIKKLLIAQRQRHPLKFPFQTSAHKT